MDSFSVPSGNWEKSCNSCKSCLTLFYLFFQLWSLSFLFWPLSFKLLSSSLYALCFQPGRVARDHRRPTTDCWQLTTDNPALGGCRASSAPSGYIPILRKSVLNHEGFFPKNLEPESLPLFPQTWPLKEFTPASKFYYNCKHGARQEGLNELPRRKQGVIRPIATLVTPVQAGVQKALQEWIPASAGMTEPQ